MDWRRRARTAENVDGGPPTAWAELPGSILKAVVEALVIALVLTLASPLIVVEAARLDPSCAHHPGLVPVDVAARLLNGDATVSSTPLVTDQFDPARAFDTRVGSAWAAPVARPDKTTVTEALELAVASTNPLASLELTWTTPVDVRLICMVNGTPRDPASYRRADRVQRADIEMSCQEGPLATELRSMPDDRIQEPQELNGHCNGATSLTLLVRQVYPGENITDAATGKRVQPSKAVAVAELTLYRPARSGEPDHSRLSGALDALRQPFS